MPELKSVPARLQFRQPPLPVFSVPPCLQRHGWLNSAVGVQSWVLTLALALAVAILVVIVVSLVVGVPRARSFGGLGGRGVRSRRPSTARPGKPDTTLALTVTRAALG